MIENKNAALIAASLEAINQCCDKQYTVDEMNKIFYLGHDIEPLHKYFNEEVLYQAAKEVEELAQADGNYRLKLYLGMVKYALVWYDYPNDSMRLRRDHILEKLCQPEVRTVKEELRSIATRQDAMATLLCATHYFNLNVKELYEGQFHLVLDTHIRNAKKLARERMDDPQENFRCLPPEACYFMDREPDSFVHYQWRNYVDALANYQLLATMNWPTISKLTFKLDDRNDTMRVSHETDYQLIQHTMEDVCRPYRIEMLSVMNMLQIGPKLPDGHYRKYLDGPEPLHRVQKRYKPVPGKPGVIAYARLHENSDRVDYEAQRRRRQTRDDGGGPEVNPLNEFVGSSTSSWATTESEGTLSDSSEVFVGLKPSAPALHALDPGPMMTRYRSRHDAEEKNFVDPKLKRKPRRNRKNPSSRRY